MAKIKFISNTKLAERFGIDEGDLPSKLGQCIPSAMAVANGDIQWLKDDVNEWLAGLVKEWLEAQA